MAAMYCVLVGAAVGAMTLAAGPLAEPWPFPTLKDQPPIIIAHRGASGYLPEHTLEAYALAVAQGADFIEPDLVMTKDGHLVARHDYFLSSTTDVADRPEFAARRREWEGRSDWFVEDFTLEEIKRLRARQPFRGRSTAFDGRFEIPTFKEILALLRRLEERHGRRIGIYPETKHPGHFAKIGLPMKTPLLEALSKAGFESAANPVFIQSFEPEILKRINAKSPLRLILLLAADENEGATTLRPFFPQGLDLAAAARFVDGIGADKRLVLDDTGRPSGLVADAHELGLLVHAWTLRDDAPGPGGDSSGDEYRALFAAGVDGIFTDFPDTGLTQRWLAPLVGTPEKSSEGRDIDGRGR